MTPFDTFAALVRDRRSIREFGPEPIPDEVLEACLELALLAPCSHNLEPWEFLCVRHPEAVGGLRALCLDQEAARSAPCFVVAVARPDRWRLGRDLCLSHWQAVGHAALVHKYRILIPLIFNDGPFSILAPLKAIAVWLRGLWRPTWRGPFGPWARQLWATKSTALACENLMLALRAAGWDSCPLEGFDEPRVKRRFGLPRPARVAMIIAVGRRRSDRVPLAQVRFDRRLFVRWL